MSASVKRTIRQFKESGDTSDIEEFEQTLADDIETTAETEEFYDLELKYILETCQKVNFKGKDNQFLILENIISKTTAKHHDDPDINKLLIVLKPDIEKLPFNNAAKLLSTFTASPLCQCIKPEHYADLEIPYKEMLEDKNKEIAFYKEQIKKTQFPVKIINMNGREKFSIYIPRNEINPSSPQLIKNLKEDIKKTIGLKGDSDIDLFYQNSFLSDGSKVQDCHFKQTSEIYYIITRNDGKITIRIIMDENEKEIEVVYTSTIEKVKEMIEKVLSIKVKQQKLTYNDTLLENEKTLSEYGINKSNLPIILEELPPEPDPDPPEEGESAA